MREERKKPLLVSDTDTDVGGSFKHVQLYDDMVMLEMKKTLCQGYIVLLTGGLPVPEQPRKKKKKNKKGQRVKEADDPGIVLAFAALTTGNVIDACFGVTMASKPSARTVQLIKDAKSALFAADDASENAAKIAVEAYKAAFQTVIAMHARLDKLNFLTKCFHEGKIRKRTCKQLESDFYMLEQIVADNK